MDFKRYFDNPSERTVMDIEYSVLGHFCEWDCPTGNTEQHFRNAIERGFDGLKCDMELTKDGEIVLCHDPGYTIDSNGRIARWFDENNYRPIHDMTLEELAALKFADEYDGEVSSPCTLNTMLSLCRKHNLAAYLTLRPEPWREETAKRMCELILANDMQRQTIINLYPGSKEAVDFVSSLIPGMVYCNTRLPDDELTQNLIDSSAADGYKIICLCRRAIESVTPEKCRYAAEKGLRIWIWEATNATDCAYYIAKGVTGFQMMAKDVTTSVVKDILDELDNSGAIGKNTPDDDFREYFQNASARKVMNIEYSSLDEFFGKGILPGNTEMHFRKSIELGFDGLKADMRLTSDGEIVLCHDPGYTLDENGRIGRFNSSNYVPIRDLPLEKVLSLEFADEFEGRRLHPCTLDTMLALCERHGKVPYLTLRPEPWRPDTAKRMVELIVKHGLQHRTIVNLFTGEKAAVECVSALLPGLVYCNTRVPKDELTIDMIDSSAEEGYNIICLCRSKIYSITPDKCRYAASKGIRIWLWATTNTIDCATDLSLGVTGYQMYTRSVTNPVITALLKR